MPYDGAVRAVPASTMATMLDSPSPSAYSSAGRMASSSVALSIIIPIYNEEDSLPRLFDTLIPILKRMDLRYEIIAVNDGSKDRSLDVLQRIAKEYPQVKVVGFARNFGQTAAIMAGIDHASGEVIVSLDADLQNDPEDIPALLAKLDEGYDVVSGWRKDRKDAAIRRNFVSRIANSLISKISGVHLNDYGCTLKAYRRHVIKGVHLYGEMHRFIPIYASWMGAKITELPVRHHPRRFGASKYGMGRVLKVVLDLFVVKFLDRHLVKPIYVFGGFGLFSWAVGLAAGLLAVYFKYFTNTSFIQTPLPLLCALCFLIGFISILMGINAEILIRTYFESTNRPTYLVSTRVNF
jgi:dolichol-phosphate mannosyltransferase